MSKKMILSIYIGTSGWNYEHWRDIFYPATFARSAWLQFHAQNFKTLEVNATFFRLPKTETFEGWKRTTPEGFLRAVKANRCITHIKRLQDTAESLEKFFGAASTIKDKLGPVLFQLPPGLAFDEDTLD